MYLCRIVLNIFLSNKIRKSDPYNFTYLKNKN